MPVDLGEGYTGPFWSTGHFYASLLLAARAGLWMWSVVLIPLYRCGDG